MTVKVANAIVAYRRRRVLDLPDWVNTIQFNTEIKIRAEIAHREKEIAERQTELAQYKRYKNILFAKHDVLKESVREILEKEFVLQIQDSGEKIEDLMVLDKEGKPSIPLEIKGVNDNVKADHVSQVTNHKRRREMPFDNQGVLIIHNMADSGNSLSDKEKAVVHPEIIKQALATKVLIIRTVDLFQCLKRAEKDPELKKKFVEAFHTEAGWLHITENSWVVETGS
jgi:hypothetical protein